MTFSAVLQFIAVAGAIACAGAYVYAYIFRPRGDRRMQDSLAREYRFTHRATEHSDFIEGVRAQIIDKDRNPVWSRPADPAAVDAMLAPLGDAELNWED